MSDPMRDDSIRYEPIGVIRTPFADPNGMPIQPTGEAAARGTVEVDEEHGAGLGDLEGFSHCILLYHLHAGGDDYDLRPTPFLDDVDRGLFATRAPSRPNPIGLSVVAIESVDGATLTVSGIDVVDGTPLLDVKPFVPRFDQPDDATAGWIEAADRTVTETRSDGRFVGDGEE